MKLPNFDEFEPFIALRKTMGVTSSASLSLVKTEALTSIHTDTTPLNWQQNIPAQKPTPVIAITAPTPPQMQPPTREPTPAAPIIQPETPPHPQPAKRPAAHTIRRPVWPRVVAVVTVNVVLIVIAVVMIENYKKQEAAHTKPSEPPAAVTAPIITPPPEKAADITAPVIASPPAPAPTATTKDTATIAPIPTAPSPPAPPPPEFPSTSNLPSNNIAVDTSVNDAPNNGDEGAVMSDNNEVAPAPPPPPVVEEEGEDTGIRIGETPPKPSETSDYDDSTNGIISGTGRQWYKTIEREKR